ncbi:hypothetical protein ACHQM5_031245 [Ranunculus cassubicifolius]
MIGRADIEGSKATRLFDARGGHRSDRSQSIPRPARGDPLSRGSSSSSPPAANGFGTGTPVPSPQSQSFSRGYGSILPTSLPTLFHRPEAVHLGDLMRYEYDRARLVLGPPDFQGSPGPTGHHATCGALPAAGPTSGLADSRVGRLLNRKDNSSEAPADVSGLPNVAVNHRVPVQEF